MNITSLEQLDLSKQYTYADYLLWRFEEKIELLKGYIRQMAAPNPFHQDVSANLLTMFKNYVWRNHKTCKVYHAPFDVRLIKNPLGRTDKEVYTVVQPDLCVICDRSKIDERGCLGSPDLIIEILSPSNPKTDLQDKFALYEENEVNEYWIVFPAEKVVQKFILENQAYKLKGSYTRTDQITPHLFPDLVINLEEVFEES